MSKIDNQELLKALENDNNTNIINLTNSIIKNMKNDVIQKLQLKKDEIKELHTKLKDYRYINEINDINYGFYIRWINLKDIDDLNLNRGAFISEIKITDNGIVIICKTRFNRHFQIKFDENLIFQKISPQEQIILKILDALAHK